MPYTGTNWPNVDTESRRPYTYDFSNRLPESDAIASVVWELTVHPNLTYRNLDPNAQTHVGTPSFDSNSCTIWVEDLLENVRYKLAAFITSAGGVQDDLFSFIQCDPKP